MGSLSGESVGMDPPKLSLDTSSNVAANTSSVGSPKNSEEMDEDATGSESASEDDNPQPLPLQSVRKREQYSKFSSWLKKKAEQVVKEEAKGLANTSGNDEILSIRTLMARQESSVLINDPREYQIELFEKAKRQNIIAVLDTGSGKTLIAVLLLRHILDAELEHRRKGQKSRIAFFLVDCVTLVFQQFAVLESNLGHRIERFCGEMGCELWSKAIWQKHFDENMVLVCTAEILYQCLMHSFISIDQINLLIFDEAHHAKKNHAYARIIKDFYITEVDPSKRPKIFGMTASPVDANEDVIHAAKELEAMLDSQISTTSDLSLVAKAISRPREVIVRYKKPPSPYSTTLSTILNEKFGQLEVLSKLFEYSKDSASYLGEWCADHIWNLVFLEKDETLKLDRLVNGSGDSETAMRPIEQRDAELALLRDARKFVDCWTFRAPEPTDINNSLSSKVVELQASLASIFSSEINPKCIIFAKRRYTARLLADLMAQVGPSNLRVGLLIGTRYGDPGDVKFSFRQQILTINKFRKGEINCLFATSIAEEGLDIPDCNVVIRFDLYDTMIQYIQSRGRARHADSTYLHMLEYGNQLQHRTITEVRQGEQKMRQFCAALPADRLLQGNDYDFSKALAKELNMRKYTDPGTGAKLTYSSSLVVLSHFIGCLPLQDGAMRQATFVMSYQTRQFVCEVQLPENSPVRFAIGHPASKKSIAKRSAAFEACLLLRKDGHLDGHLIPTYQKRLPSMRNAQLALNMKQSNFYKMKIKPIMWQETLGSEPVELFVNVLELEAPELLGRPCQPLALLTRTPLPQFPKFPLYLQAGRTSQLICTSIMKSMTVLASTLADLNGFTLRIYKDIFNKKFEDNISNMSYWLAPILLQRKIDQEEQVPESLIDWSIMKEVNAREQLDWSPGRPHSYYSNRYFVDRWSGGRRFFSVEVAPGLRCDHPLPEGANRTKNDQTILEFTSTHLFKKSKARATWDLDQPVILAHSIPTRLNWLDDWTEKEKGLKTTTYICPEPLLLSVLPVSVVSMAYLFPAILTRLESYLISAEVCDLLGLEIDLGLALEALTKDSDNTDEHKIKQIHVRRGMGKNYERLEFIGDSFLKMATSISLFSQNPEDNEYDYHVKRMLLICNKNLFGTAVAKKLFEYVRTAGFSRRNWYPQDLVLLQGKGHKKAKVEEHKHQLGDKTIADVCEALIGAALLSSKDTGDMDMAVKAVTALVSHEDHDVSEWSGYYRLYSKPRYQLSQASAAQLDLAQKIEERHDYHFRYPRLLQSAFTHPSLPFSWSDRIPCYQRLEFLGDALLDMACINFLFHRHPDEDPQWLTEHKMAMVSNRFLAALAARLGFHRHIRVGGAVVEAQNRYYVEEVKEAEEESNGSPDYWTSTKYAPKALSDVVEAYIGAIFVDSEYNYNEVERFFEAHIRWFFEDIHIYDTFANNHPTTLLHNRLSLEYKCKLYRLMANELPANPYSTNAQGAIIAAVMIHGEVIADATASSSKNAKVRASERALQLMDGLSVPDFRMKFGCDCKGFETEQDEKKAENVVADGDTRMEWEEHMLVPNAEVVEEKVGPGPELSVIDEVDEYSTPMEWVNSP